MPRGSSRHQAAHLPGGELRRPRACCPRRTRRAPNRAPHAARGRSRLRGAARQVHMAGGIQRLISMVDGSNLEALPEKKGWAGRGRTGCRRRQVELGRSGAQGGPGAVGIRSRRRSRSRTSRTRTRDAGRDHRRRRRAAPAHFRRTGSQLGQGTPRGWQRLAARWRRTRRRRVRRHPARAAARRPARQGAGEAAAGPTSLWVPCRSASAEAAKGPSVAATASGETADDRQGHLSRGRRGAAADGGEGHGSLAGGSTRRSARAIAEAGASSLVTLLSSGTSRRASSRRARCGISPSRCPTRARSPSATASRRS